MNNVFIATLCSAVFVLNGLALFFAVEGRAVGQGVEPLPMSVNGEKVSSGATVDKIFHGISFAVSHDWEADQPNGEEIIFLSSKKVTALGWAIIAPQSEESDWAKRLNGPMPFMHRLFNP